MSPPFEAPFNAVHMSLIPRGKDRGKVIVWNSRKFRLNTNGVFVDQGLDWSFQTWSIVDPAPGQVVPRFQNFLLPLHPVLPTPVGGNPILENLFCAGQCWTEFGDLVVAGGDSSGAAGTAMVMLYRPDEAGQAWPILLGTDWTNDFNGAPLYGGAHGRWNYGPALEANRYYPTVTFTSRLLRTGTEVALVFGGSQVVGGGFGVNPHWNTYEALRLPDPNVQQTQVGLIKDFVGLPTNPTYIFQGPDDGVAQTRLLEEYPRIHWVGSAQAFMSGYEPLSAKVQHEVPPTVPGTWDDYNTGGTSTGQASVPPSFVHRHDGASVFYARSGPLTNFVGRMGGFANGKGTDTTEFLVNAAGTAGAPWIEGPRMVYERGWQNAVILPDASILVIGGTPSTALPSSPTQIAEWLAVARSAEMFKDGKWGLVASMATPRGYHATAVLLPDGRVIVGGGEERHSFQPPASSDYEIYSPWYMTEARPAITSIAQSPSQGSNPDGSVRVQYGSPLHIGVQLPLFVTPGKIVLMAPGAMTHHSDMHARYVEMDQIGVQYSGQTGVATIQCAMPAEAIAPRGYYMVFAMTSGGVPSPAGWIQITQ